MNANKYFINKKYKFFLFLPLAAIAISYLIGATDISYIFNIPMAMSPVQTEMPMQMQMGQTTQTTAKVIKKEGLSVSFSKINPQHSHKLNLLSSITCVECQNLPAAYYPATFYYGSFVKTIPSKGKFHIKHYSSDIPHPPQNPLAV